MSLRLFAALEVPDDAATRLKALMRGVPGARWRPRENLHLTLRFFGEMDEARADDLDAALEEVAGATGPFDLALQGAGHFGGDAPHALWIGAAANPALATLAQRCERAARRTGLPAEARKFTPHVTVAYLDGGMAALDRVMAFTQRYALFGLPPWTVDRFGLYSSIVRPNAPSLYRLEAEYPLRG